MTDQPIDTDILIAGGGIQGVTLLHELVAADVGRVLLASAGDLGVGETLHSHGYMHHRYLMPAADAPVVREGWYHHSPALSRRPEASQAHPSSGALTLTESGVRRMRSLFRADRARTRSGFAADVGCFPTGSGRSGYNREDTTDVSSPVSYSEASVRRRSSA